MCICREPAYPGCPGHPWPPPLLPSPVPARSESQKPEGVGAKPPPKEPPVTHMTDGEAEAQGGGPRCPVRSSAELSQLGTGRRETPPYRAPPAGLGASLE